MALMMTAAVAATTFVTGGSAVYAEKAEDYSEPLPEDYEGTLTMWGWDESFILKELQKLSIRNTQM